MQAVRVRMQLQSIVMVPRSWGLSTNAGAIIVRKMVRLALLAKTSSWMRSNEGSPWLVEVDVLAMSGTSTKSKPDLSYAAELQTRELYLVLNKKKNQQHNQNLARMAA